MTRLAVLLSPLLLLACSRPIDRSAAAEPGNDEQQMQRSIDQDLLAVRLKAAEARIVELERRVGALEATPEKVDLQLLTQRLEQLEAKVYAGSPPPAETPAVPDAPPATTPRRADAAPAPKPTPTPSGNRFNPFGL